MDCYVVSTPYHLIVAASMRKNGDCLLIEKNNFIKNEFIYHIIEKYFLDNYEIVISYKELLKKPFKVKENLKKLKHITIEKYKFEKIYAFNDSDPIIQYIFANQKGDSKCIILEEGIGLYNDLHNRKYFIKKAIGRFVLGKWYQVIRRIGTYKYTSTIYAKNIKYLNAKQKEKETINYAYQELRELIEKEKIGVENQNLWFIGQPLVEDGICTEKEYIEFLSRIINIFGKKKILVKVHPREDIKKYEIYKEKINIYENSSIPLELLISSTRDVNMLTISSSSLINCSDGVKVFFLYKLFNKGLSFPEKLVKNKINVKIINNWEELGREFYDKI